MNLIITKMKTPRTDQDIRNEIMECWTKNELRRVVERYHDQIKGSKTLMDQVTSTLARIRRVTESKDIYAYN